MYKGRIFIREQAYSCGDYMDGAVYPVFQAPGVRRKRSKPTSEIQERLNARNAEKKLTRLIHSNFTDQDLALHLTYDEEPKDTEEAKRILGNFLRRLKRKYQKAGIELKYITETERGKVNGRVHHHLIITGGVDRDIIEQAWGQGYCNSKRLQFGTDGVEGLAHYIAKDKRSKRDRRLGIGSEERYKRWNGSKNLVQPQPAVYDGQYNMGEVEEIVDAIETGNAAKWFEDRYPEYILTEASYVKNEVNRGVYITYAMRRRR